MGPIARKVVEGMRNLHEQNLEPLTVVFNNLGWQKAMQEALADGMDAHGQTFMGLKRMMHANGPDEIVVTHLTPSEYAQTIVTAKRNTPGSVTVKFDPSKGALTAEIIGQNLTASQLQDICRAWLDSDDATHWGDFEKGLDALITKHGSFE